ncbi:MAG: hypothetical protein R8M38_09185 [Mariprofundaceae bacterium]
MMKPLVPKLIQAYDAILAEKGIAKNMCGVYKMAAILSGFLS